jgi:hypothetical protein
MAIDDQSCMETPVDTFLAVLIEPVYLDTVLTRHPDRHREARCWPARRVLWDSSKSFANTSPHTAEPHPIPPTISTSRIPLRHHDVT